MARIETRDRRLRVGGDWIETGDWIEVENPYDGSSVGRVPKAGADIASRAIGAAAGASAAGPPPAGERAAILERASRLVGDRIDELAATIAAEAGKPFPTARIEASRCVDTLAISAVAARTLAGHEVPMEATASGVGKIGLSIRVPLGVVAAIAPFNFPLNLVAHKLGPALAAGNSVVLKPASATPLSAIALVEILEEAGAPDGLLNVICGSGSEIGEAFTSDERVAAISFTGSAGVGWGIREAAPKKKVLLELGSTAPLIVADDGDWRAAAEAASLHGYTHAGQSCISTQRAIVHRDLVDDFCSLLVEKVSALRVGDPLDPETQVGPLIDRGERDRVKEWIDEAAAAGAEVLTGGDLVDEQRCIAPAVIREPGRDLRVWREEIFGPVVTVNAFGDWDEAIEMANDARYGLNAGVYTRSVGRALDAARRLEFGSVLVNSPPTFRADQMPYGGVKDSGNTREGPAYAIRELTEDRFVSLEG